MLPSTLPEISHFFKIHISLDKAFRPNDDFTISFELTFKDAIDENFQLEGDLSTMTETLTPMVISGPMSGSGSSS